ncbi:FMN-binding negative transcriptional regulator [Lysobacter pythonis]|uniref:FMN-binding negative transcriptional regulator n=1 Tax=Solilutibacter pythonis TaxID=2483112 RepID=A0A3M2I4J3_9GAMM|nr:FMN-binding negative transcriptional regulator [Lysobacter pythonis]RMH94950.1 FMN-binding negative transcriptional regulator [Lysobacter pythonis]
MFVQRVFANDDPSRLDTLIAHNPFVTLLTATADGAPIASQIPVLYRRDADGVLVEGHWARANPQARLDDAPALVIVHGPHAYVSASRYTDKAEQARVPTWNYSTAHLHWRLQQFDDEESLIELIARMSRHFEQAAGGDWRFDPDNPAERVQLRGVRGFRLRPEHIEIKDKLSQNQPHDNRRAVAGRLAAQNGHDARHIARLMQDTLKEPDDAT